MRYCSANLFYLSQVCVLNLDDLRVLTKVVCVVRWISVVISGVDTADEGYAGCQEKG